MQDLLCASYYLRASGFFQQLVEAGRARAVPAEDPSSTQSLAALIELLHALQSHQQSSDSIAGLPDLAEKVGQHAAVVFEVLPDVATDAALALWEAARPVLEGAVGAKDMGADLAVKVILSMYIVDKRMVSIRGIPPALYCWCCSLFYCVNKRTNKVLSVLVTHSKL